MIACCYEGCGASVCFAPEIEARLRSTHEFWMCPFGHEQHFTKETSKDVEIGNLRRRLHSAEKDLEWWMVQAEDTMEVFATCPLECGWRSHSGLANRWMSMLRHFERAHQAMAEGTPMAERFFEVRREEAKTG